jgi:anti-anti-sigma factor
MKPADIDCKTSSIAPGVILLQLNGRIDGFGSKVFAGAIEPVLADCAIRAIALDMSGVGYLSSAGIRVFTVALKRLKERDGLLAVCCMTQYCRDIFEISGMGNSLPILDSQAAALKLCRDHVQPAQHARIAGSLERLDTPDATLLIMPGDEDARGVVEILGNVKEVLHADLTEDQIASKTFSETAYSIGCGALGDELEDYFPLMGEMITIGGTMVWLPTDGHDTPDFLIPRKSSRAITIRTGFNANLAGGFDELFLFTSKDPNGIRIDQLYRNFFDIAKRRRPDYRGVLGLAGRAEFTEVYGAGIRKSPIRRFRPQNGETILHPSNINDWFSGDREPRLRQVTGLLCGIGVDLTADLSHFESAHVDLAFYRHPDNTAGKPHLLHNHSVFFTQQPFPENPVDLAAEIQSVVDNGDFRDMRHLLDQSRISRAFLGVSYAQEIRIDSDWP